MEVLNMQSETDKHEKDRQIEKVEFQGQNKDGSAEYAYGVWARV